MKTILLAVAPYDWDAHCIFCDHTNMDGFESDGWHIHRCHIYPDDVGTTLSNLQVLFQVMLDNNFQGDLSDVTATLMNNL